MSEPLTSALMILFGRFVIVVNVLHIIESSFLDSCIECLGGIYMFAICNYYDVEK